MQIAFGLSWEMLLPMLMVFLIDIFVIFKGLGKLFDKLGAKLKVEYPPLDANTFFDYVFAYPLGEEILFRGMFLWPLAYLFFRGELSILAWLAIILVAGANGLLHLTEKKSFKEYNNRGLIWVVVYTSLCFVLYGYLTVTTISIMPALICHIAANGYFTISFKLKEKKKKNK